MSAFRSNVFATLNAFLLAAVVIVLVYNVQTTTKGKDVAGNIAENEVKYSRFKRSANVDENVPNKTIYVKDREGGAIYIRWGRKKCPASSELVYKGYAGGTHYTHTGGASNYLCMPEEPIWDKYDTKTYASSATIYGAEFRTGSNSFPFSNDNTEVDSLNVHDVPCAVCLANERFTSLMIPARNECYTGWTLEYHGYLVTSAKTFKGRSEYVCMDQAPEADVSGYSQQNGALFYSVEGVCGALPCPPYFAGRELACAVCTK